MTTDPCPAESVSFMPLHGPWQRSVAGRVIDTVEVPGTFPPMGACTLSRSFGLPEPVGTTRCFLRTEGVLAWARFVLNGEELGKAGPWSRHRLEIRPGLLRAQNLLSVELDDILAPFGPTPGRRFDAGLFRPIGIERRPRTFIGDWSLRSRFGPGHAVVEATVVVDLDGDERPDIGLSLCERHGGRLVARAEGAAGSPLHVTLADPRLWSPQSPSLYRITVTAGADAVSEDIGFRHLESRGRDLWLNGERLLLKGVCRHEFMSGFGYSPPEQEVRRELARIRHAGFNHVRLVHSPQAPCVPRIAAEVGLLVSEEPGTCFHDLADPSVADPAIDALGALVRRDRCLPSILAWYIYNECNPNTPYAVRAAAVCRELDPGCLVAMADCSGRTDEIKAMVAAADLSFYGINCYSYWGHDFQKLMDAYTDRPLVFTEWGGCMAQGNPRVMAWLARTFASAMGEGLGRRMSGASYWVWADYEEYSRAEFAAIDGWTVEGLIDRERCPKPDLALMSQWCFDVDHPPERSAAKPEILLRLPQRPGRFSCVDLDLVPGDQSAVDGAMEKARNPAIGQPSSDRLAPGLPVWPALETIQVAGIPFRCRGGAGPLRPLLLGGDRKEAVIPIGRRVAGVSVLGHVAWAAAYPANGIFSVHHRDPETVRSQGSVAGEYAFVFEDGIERIPLRHGVHILRANEICRWWRTGPCAPETAAAIRITTHPSYEILRIDLWERSWPQPRHLIEIRWRLEDGDSVLAMHGLTTHDI